MLQDGCENCTAQVLSAFSTSIRISTSTACSECGTQNRVGILSWLFR